MTAEQNQPTQQISISIQQLNLAYDKQQDRLLLRVGLNNQTEMAVWLTHRIAKVMWRLLHGESHLPINNPAPVVETPQANPQAAVQQFKQEVQAVQTLQQLDFSTEYQPRKEALNQGFLLAAQVNLITQTNQTSVLEMLCVEGLNMRFDLTTELTIALCNMLQLSTKESEWDIGAGAAAPAVVVLDTQVSKVLH